MSSVLSNRLFAVLKFVHTYSQQNGFPPTVRSIADTFKTHHSNIGDALTVLEACGLLQKEYRTARAIKVTEEGKRVLHAPLTALLDAVNATRAMRELITNIACHDYDHAFATARSWADSCDGKRE